MSVCSPALSARQCELIAKAIDYEITALKAQISYEPDSEDSKGWRADIMELVQARKQIAGDPPLTVFSEND
jgi:hypothetical protein